MKSGENRMSEKDFDTLLKSIMEQDTLHTSAPEAGWNKIFDELHKDAEKQPKAVPFAGASRSLHFRKWVAAACGIIAVAFGGYQALQMRSGETETPQLPHIVTAPHNAQPPATPQVPATTILPNSNTQTSIDNNRTPNTSSFYHTSSVRNNQQTINPSQLNTPAYPTNIISQPELPQDKIGYVPEVVITPDPLKEQEDIIAPVQKQESPSPINTNPYLDYDHNRYSYASNSGKNSSIGVNGGYNFGTLNSGYAVALTAKTKITDDLFIGGSLGIAMNNMQTSNSTALSVPVNNAKARPTANNMNAINTPAVTNSTHQLAYLQFNPTIGYNITKNLTFSVGGDVQRLVNTKSDEVNIIFNAAQNESAIIPKTDLGVTGKTEFRLSKNLSTGLVYREGINNMFGGSGDIGYLNRRYIQIQMSYTIPVKF